jgi:hypothetical protein
MRTNYVDARPHEITYVCLNFALWQWVLGFVLDVFVKSAIVVFIGLLITLGAALPSGFVFFAALLSMFNFICLFLGCLLVSLLELVRLNVPLFVKFLLTMIVANVLFVLSYAALTGLGHRHGEILPGFGEQLIAGSCLTITNIIPILITAGCGRVFRRS